MEGTSPNSLAEMEMEMETVQQLKEMNLVDSKGNSNPQVVTTGQVVKKWEKVPKTQFQNNTLFRNPSEGFHKPKKEGLVNPSWATKAINFLLSILPEDESYIGSKHVFWMSYLNHTFVQLVSEEKLKQFTLNEENTIIVWNTGLLSNYQEPIFCIMVPYGANSRFEPEKAKYDSNGEYYFDSPPKMSTPENIKGIWHIKAFATQSFIQDQRRMAELLKTVVSQEELKTNPLYFTDSDIPKRAWYFSNCTVDDIVFNPEIPMSTTVNMSHLFGTNPSQVAVRRMRLPQPFRNCSDQELVERFQSGIARMRTKLIANYRLAVPFFFTDKNAMVGEVQLLVPVYLEFGSNTKNMCIVSLKLIRDEKNNPSEYKVIALLEDKHAYLNARLLQQVDQEWLKSVTTKPQEINMKSYDYTTTSTNMHQNSQIPLSFQTPTNQRSHPRQYYHPKQKFGKKQSHYFQGGN